MINKEINIYNLQFKFFISRLLIVFDHRNEIISVKKLYFIKENKNENV